VNALRPQIRCREIAEADIEAVADLLARGFYGRSRDYWLNGLQRQAARQGPEGYPRFGYMLDHDGRPVGVLLLIYSFREAEGGAAIHCNLSSWYVEPAFRSYAALLISCALRHKDITYLNVTAAPSTRAIAEAQGYLRYNRGLFVAAPALSLRSSSAEVKSVSVEPPAAGQIESWEQDLLLEHAKYGCISLWVETAEGAYPFVFRVRRLKGIAPYPQLVYCRDIQDLARFARPIGRFLLSRGHPLVAIDSDGPIAGLPGKYFDGRMPKYFRGRERPRLGDLAYTEIAMFGV